MTSGVSQLGQRLIVPQWLQETAVA